MIALKNGLEKPSVPKTESRYDLAIPGIGAGIPWTGCIPRGSDGAKKAVIRADRGGEPEKSDGHLT